MIQALSNVQNSLWRKVETPENFMEMSKVRFIASDLLCCDDLLKYYTNLLS